MINKTILMGRICNEITLRYTDSQKAVTSFTVAVDNGHGDNKKTDFINVVAWEKTAEFINKWFAKGRMIVVIGRISTRSYTGNDGAKKYVTEVVASEVSFGDSKKEEDATPEQAPDNDFTPLAADDEDLPWR